MRWGLRSQLLIPLLALLLGVVAMSVWAALASAGHARGRIEDQVRQIALTLQRARFPLTENVLTLMKGFSGADYLLVSPAGERVSTLPGPEVTPPADIATADTDAVRLAERVEAGGVAYLCAGLRLRQGPSAGATLYVFYPESLWRDALWQAVRPALWLGSLGGLAAVALALVLANRLTARVRELERRTRLIAAGDFGPMDLPARDDELRDLARSVNDMAGRLAQYRDTLRQGERLRLLGQVSGGLAHQLRNGVTGARLAVQLHAADCAGGDREALAVALRQLDLVELHLKRFLDLGRQEEPRLEPCDLVPVLTDAVDLLRPRCRHAAIDLRWRKPADPVVIHGDARQLQQVFLNLITNAADAAGPRGWVAVGVEPAGDGRCRVTVRDSGPGPGADVADRLFEPFVTGKPEGVGLGLAVARQVVKSHGGSITWRREADATCFAVELPGQAEQLQGKTATDPVGQDSDPDM